MIVYDKGQNEQLIYGMWERNFHDPIPYARFYFENVYPKNQVILWQDQEIVKGMIHWNSYDQQFFGRKAAATYIVGVATDEEYRREGVMRKLLAETFAELRKKGESFTYLMPADENYYLPFDFRFGMSSIEQEIYMENEIPSRNQWSFQEEPDSSILEEIAASENKVRDLHYDIHTRISPDYLRQLGQEAKGDFARMLYIFDGKTYIGRCVIGAEDSYMTLSQLMCVFDEKREEFLEQLLAYGEERYHYGAYKIATDLGWRDAVESLAGKGKYRMSPAKEVPIIMFRILDIEKFVRNIKAKKEQEIQLYIADTKLPVQSGRYIWHASPEGCSLRKYEGQDEILDGGKISIADLTDLLFAGGEKKISIDQVSGLNEEGKSFFENIIPVGNVCITEIV